MLLYHLCHFKFYNNNLDANVLPKIYLFFPLVFISVSYSQRSQQIIPENQIAFMKRWLPPAEVLAANPFQLK